jgi:hypothetical protein
MEKSYVKGVSKYIYGYKYKNKLKWNPWFERSL